MFDNERSFFPKDVLLHGPPPIVGRFAGVTEVCRVCKHGLLRSHLTGRIECANDSLLPLTIPTPGPFGLRVFRGVSARPCPYPHCRVKGAWMEFLSPQWQQNGSPNLHLIFIWPRSPQSFSFTCCQNPREVASAQNIAWNSILFYFRREDNSPIHECHCSTFRHFSFKQDLENQNKELCG